MREIRTLRSMSGERNRSDGRVPKPPRRLFVTHGEPAAADASRMRIKREFGWECHVPAYLETVDLNEGKA